MTTRNELSEAASRDCDPTRRHLPIMSSQPNRLAPPARSSAGPAPLDSSVDAPGCSVGKMGRECRKTPSSARSSPVNDRPPASWPKEYFERFPKDRYQTEVESWRHLQSESIEFTMKRLREPIDAVQLIDTGSKEMTSSKETGEDREL
jgi:hypothetical protein